MARHRLMAAATSAAVVLMVVSGICMWWHAEGVSSRSKRSLGEYEPTSFIGALVKKLGIPHFYRNV